MILVDSEDQVFICKDCNECDEAYQGLKEAGYKDSEITITILSGETVMERYTVDKPPHPQLETLGEMSERRTFSAMQ